MCERETDLVMTANIKVKTGIGRLNCSGVGGIGVAQAKQKQQLVGIDAAGQIRLDLSKANLQATTTALVVQHCAKPSEWTLPCETEDEEGDQEPPGHRWQSLGVRAAMLEDGEGREDGEGEEVAEDTEDDAVDADVERQLRDHVVPGVDALRAHHRRVRPPPLAVPLPGRHPRRSLSSTRLRFPVVLVVSISV